MPSPCSDRCGEGLLRRGGDNSGKTVVGDSLSETNSSHLKMDGWKIRFLLGWLPGRCYVSFRGCTPFKHSRCASSFKKGETKIKERWTKGTMLGVSFPAIVQCNKNHIVLEQPRFFLLRGPSIFALAHHHI